MAGSGFIARGLPDKAESFRYRMQPRPRPQYHSVVDASRLFGGQERQGTQALFRNWTESDGGAPKLWFHTSLELPDGRLEERVRYGVRDGILVSERLERQVYGLDDRLSRDERIDFHAGPYRFPADLYPEVYAPFLMRWDPAPLHRRSFHSWISDRFVARIWFELHRRKVRVEVPAGVYECSEILMYPDLNDWVPLGNVITTLAKPILPRYHVWLALEPPHPLVRFEGAYGPPGAPEVVVELLEP
jgi:hypothetical protein